MFSSKKTLTFKQMINLNLGTFGILFAWQLLLANMSGIYAFFGAQESDLGYLWLIPSILGLVAPLLIGYLSDKTHTSFGKRLPYIFFGSLVAAIFILLLPNSPSLKFSILFFCIFTAAINAALQPFRALIADIVPAQEHTKAYATQAVLIGIGAAFSSSLPWLLLHAFKIEASTTAGIPLEIKLAFYIGAVTLMITVGWTTLKTRQYLPKQSGLLKGRLFHMPSIGLKKITSSFMLIPKVMLQVSVVQFFTWLGTFCFIVYFTPAIEQSIYHLPVAINPGLSNALSHQLLEKSVVLNGLACAVYMTINIIYAYCIPFLSKKITRKVVHIISLMIGGASLISLLFIHQAAILLVAMIGFGIAWASFNCIPFAMIANVLPAEGLGVYMGLFNVSICLPQIFVSFFAGYILRTLLKGDAVILLVLAGISMIIAALLTIPIRDKSVKEIV